MKNKKVERPRDDSKPKRGAKKKYRKPELTKHGVLSIVEGD